ncbi:hypothetical protein MPER_08259 [Moniliophthora perniciosa FA553]|nr:hypothetical protein MPER_08259 [Moniliophthora perniciosa FA553]
MAAPSNPTTFPDLFNFAAPEQSGATFTPMTYSQWGEPVEHDGLITYNEPFVPGTRELMYLVQTKQYDTALFQAADNVPDGMPGALMRQAVYLNRQQGVIETVIQDYERHVEQMTKVVESYKKWKAANSSHLVNVVTRLAPQQLVMQGPVTFPSQIALDSLDDEMSQKTQMMPTQTPFAFLGAELSQEVIPPTPETLL